MAHTLCGTFQWEPRGFARTPRERMILRRRRGTFHRLSLPFIGIGSISSRLASITPHPLAFLLGQLKAERGSASADQRAAVLTCTILTRAQRQIGLLEARSGETQRVRQAAR